MRKTLLLLGASLLLPFSTLSAQEVFVNADFVSNYMWRGMKNGNASIQPTIGFSTGGFTAYAWGSTEFREENNEVDLTLTYEYKNFMLYFSDIYYQNDDEKGNYFNYSQYTTGHTFDLGLIYTVSEKFPLSIGWYTIVAGNDFRKNDKRAWSSYIEFLYPFTVKVIDLEIEAGVTPWEGVYADSFNVTNIALKASKAIRINDTFSLPIFAQLGTNPNEKQVYFVFGISL